MRRPPVVSLFVVAIAWLAAGCSSDDLVAPGAGQLRITTSTDGSAGDPAGYTLVIDGGDPALIGANEVLLREVAAGEHTVVLGQLPGDCVVIAGAERTVSVPPEAIADVVFAVTCGPSADELRVTTSTTGPLPDPDGYELRIDEGSPRTIGVNETLTVPALEPGTHLVELSGVAANCAVESDNPVTVELLDGEPALVDFRITCSAGARDWTSIPGAPSADFTSVWGAGDGVAFVGGERDANRGVESVILTYDGQGWVSRLRRPDFRLRALWGTSASSVYAVGYGFFTPVTTILHDDGGGWSPVLSLEPQNGEELTFESIWGSSDADVFAVGAGFDGPLGRSLIYHYDGSVWERMPVDGPVSPILSDVWGFSGGDVYAVGRDQVADPSVGVILHYDGARWAPVLEVERLTLNGVWGSSPSDVFAVGFQVEERGDEFLVSGAIWHYDGSSWQPSGPTNIGVLHEVWGTSADDVYAVGDDGLILRYDGTEWTATTVAASTLLGVWGRAPGEVVAAGLGGAVFGGTP